VSLSEDRPPYERLAFRPTEEQRDGEIVVPLLVSDRRLGFGYDGVPDMKAMAPLLISQLVTPELVKVQTVDLLVRWTLDPVPQGPISGCLP
jgi:hypothetical protein